MAALLGPARAAAAGLAAFLALLLVLRARSCSNRGEALLFALVLGVALLRVLVPWRSAPAALLGLALVWSGGEHLRALAGKDRRAGSWLRHVFSGAVAVAVCAAVLMGYWDSLPARLLYALAFSVQSAYALWDYGRRVRQASRLSPRQGLPSGAALVAYGIVLAALLIAAGLEVLLPGSTRLSLVEAGVTFLFLGTAGYMVGEEGYLAGPGRAGSREAGSAAAPELRAARARMLATESSLFALDRLVATSLLSAGTAHEFRGILAGIRASGEFALRHSGPGPVRQALERVLEHTLEGERTVLNHLDGLVRHGREEALALDVQRDLGELYELLRSSCRRRGVELALRVDPGVVIRVRRGELVQVLLNLARNSLESLEVHRDGTAVPRLTVTALRREREALLEVADSGPGVDIAHVERLFEPGGSEGGSRGLGLYLSRLIVEHNGGTLEYVPVERGGCFRISLPLEAEA
ncbi:MAG: HAMP domain-containing histidine kinase [Spirochaetales bacterium]|nr:HAMP domain-containing histidine kinase [Spirochaetales bacterium]